MGIVVSGKVGNAVVRNRVRRRLREALRGLLAGGLRPEASFRGTASVDMVVIARPSAAEAGYAELRAALERAMERAGLL